jgi:hypothetical protein
MTTHPYEDIDAFALGALDEQEAARVLEHADACPTCAVLMAEAMRAGSSLEPEGQRRIPRRDGGARLQPRARATWYGWAAAVAAAATIALFVWNVNLRSGSLEVPIASLVHSHFQHHELRGSGGSAKVIQALDGSWVYLVGDQLAPRSQYYLWETVGGNQREVGAVATNGRGEAAAFFRQPPVKVEAFVLANAPGTPSSAGTLRWP